MYIKSPFNYIGNKYRLLPQILPLFPQGINTFYDVFCGGLDVSINVDAKYKVANDINIFVIEILRRFKAETPQEILEGVDSWIKKFNLSKENKEAYYKCRDYYNENKDPLLLYVLMCHSFNYQFRFNSKGEYNNPAGTNRSSFSPVMRDRLLLFMERLNDVSLENKNFKEFNFERIEKSDFVYLDPPYRSSLGSYNDGKRGFEGWGVKDDLRLFAMLDNLNDKGVRFALSNVFFNNGLANKELKQWSERYVVHTLKINYGNSNYQRKNIGETKEVLVTNY